MPPSSGSPRAGARGSGAPTRSRRTPGGAKRPCGGPNPLDHARRLARSAGVSLLRVDCYRGPDVALVRYYESHGFVATDEFTVDLPRGPWPGQVLEQRLA